MLNIDELLLNVKDYNGSDLHLCAGQPPRIRRHGALEEVGGWEAVTAAELEEALPRLASEDGWARFIETQDIDFAYVLRGVGRFRANYFVQEHGMGAVFRLIPEEIVPLEQLHLPPAVEKIAHLRDGLVLVTGPTGSGKSTTLAAIIDKINSTYSRHIVTIEDPVEFMHKNKRSVISHREVGTDTPDFASAVRMATREDADVLLLGELRDHETMARALDAAEMGVLVLSTLHTNSAASTVDRMIEVFPGEQQPLVRAILAGALVAVLSQTLVPKADGTGRAAALELLFRTPALPSVILEGNTAMIDSIIGSGKAEGMQRMDDALVQLVRDGVVSQSAAYLVARDKSLIERAAPPDR